MATGFSNSGSGSQYSNTYGTQNNNSSSGNQFNANTINYNAQNQSDSKLLADLRVTDPRNDKTRIERRKGGLLRESYRWILDHEAFIRWQTDTQSSLLWIRGDPGKGKTMLICGIIDELPARMPEWDTIYFFCEATDSRLNNATAVLRSLLYLLLRKRPSLSRFIREEHEHAGKRLFEDANGWDVLDGTFTSIVQDGGLNDFILIIDALDECTAGLDQLLDFIVRLSSLNVKVIASSRNWLSIEEAVADVSDQVCIKLELNEGSISAAVNRYISHKVDQLASRKRYDIDTRNEIHDYLSSKAHDTFLWVALAADQLGKSSRRRARMQLEELPEGLDALYKGMLARTWESMDRDLCRRILAVVSIVFRPVTLSELVSLADLAEFRTDMVTLEEIVGECGCLLIVKDNIVYFVHQSAKEFLTQYAREEIMPSGIRHEHSLVLSRSLEVMTKTCRRNIYSLKGPGAPLSDIRTPIPDPLGPATYACVYWAEHFDDGRCPERQQYHQVYDFLKQHFLHWVEALSLLRSMSGGITGLFKLVRAIQRLDGMSQQKPFLRDALRFIRYYRVAIEICPLQVYSSALIFSPTRSIIRTHFQSQVVDWIIKMPQVVDEWSPCIQTLEGHRGPVHSLAFSPDGGTLASASNDRTVKLWDAMTGHCLQTLQSHEDEIVSVVFSLKGDTLASASTDGVVKLWDKATGRLLNTFYSKNSADPRMSVSFCSDDEQLALGCQETVEIWDTATGQRVQQFQEYGSSFNGTAFTANGALFASCEDTACVSVLDTHTGACLKTLDPRCLHGHSGGGSLAFSPSGTRLLTCSRVDGLRLWDTETNQSIWVEKVKSHAPLAYSRDGGLIACGAREDTAVEIRDEETGRVLQRLSINFPSALAFSIDGTQLFSGSLDQMIRVWDLTRHQRLRLNELEMPVSDVSSTTMSHKNIGIDEVSGTHPEILSSNSHNANKVDCTTADEDLETIDTYYTRIIAVALSCDGKRVATLSRDSFKVWDFTTGQCVETLSGGTRLHDLSWGASLAFSRDGLLLADASGQCITISDAATALRLKNFEAHTKEVTLTAFSNDGLTLASSSKDGTVKLWDSASGHCKVTIIVPEVIRYMKFAESGSHIITQIGTINLETVSTTDVDLSTPHTPEMTKSNPQGYILSVEDECAWIQKDSKFILWIPPEYRTQAYDVRGSAIALGCASGRVLMLGITPDLSSR